VLCLVQAFDRGLSLLIGSHLDKTETFTSASVTIRNHLGAVDSAKLGKELFQIGTRNVEAQITTIQFSTHFLSPVVRNISPLFHFPDWLERD
jgi:hypothetical protein